MSNQPKQQLSETSELTSKQHGKICQLGPNSDCRIFNNSGIS